MPAEPRLRWPTHKPVALRALNQEDMFLVKTASAFLFSSSDKVSSFFFSSQFSLHMGEANPPALTDRSLDPAVRGKERGLNSKARGRPRPLSFSGFSKTTTRNYRRVTADQRGRFAESAPQMGSAGWPCPPADLPCSQGSAGQGLHR